MTSYPVKERTVRGFGARLRTAREQRGLTQAELGAAVGVSNRVIAYYEQDGAQPPGAMLVELARALKVSSDELLGVKSLKRIEQLPPADQRAVLKFVDALVTSRKRGA